MNDIKLVFIALWALLPGATLSFAQDSATCLGCHASAEPEKLGASVHGSLDCTACHADQAGKEFPHERKPGPVECGTCHGDQDAQFKESLHGKALSRGDSLAPRCQNCHGSHAITPVKSTASAVAPLRVPYVCGSCHSEGAPAQKQRTIHQAHILENYSESIHGEGLLKKGLSVAATCVSCHGGHRILRHTDPASTIAKANIADTCRRCHAQIEETHRKVIDGKLWEAEPHKVPACIECHQPHKARRVYYDQGMADRDCLRCHGRPGLRSKSGPLPMTDAMELGSSAHAKVSCAQCHVGASPSRNRPCETVKKVDCSVCHNDQVVQYRSSVHGALFQKGDANAPTCLECHGKHGILGKKNTRSPSYPTNVPALCARCHREGEKAAVRYLGKEHEITKRYTESVHGKGLLKSGLTVTAMCTSCHTAHGELPASDPRSTVHTDNIPNTCSQCHHGVYEKFANSVHGAAAKGPPSSERGRSPFAQRAGAPGKQALPNCNDCHTAHSVRRTDQGGFKLEVMSRCGRCHEEVAKTYFETYHGKVSQLGYAKTAKCHDCHGAHDIFPVNDPRSHLSRQNIVETCRNCHPDAGRRFAGYLTHATHHDPGKYPLIFWTFWGMTSLLLGTFGFFWLHTLLWLPRALQLRREHPPRPYDPREPQHIRFPLLYRWLHGVMIVSFITLALTGMSLKFSYTRWAQILSHLLGGFETAGYIHRAAAVVMFGLFFTHLWDIVSRKRREAAAKRPPSTERGRSPLAQWAGSWKDLLLGPDSMLPNLTDLWEFRDTLKWYLGLSSHPRYGRWTYWEKFDYFAVFWGIAIIGSSGLMLWFPEAFTRVLPGWLINVATIIHSDEALLATGFIFTVHFFNTHLRPDKFPMDLAVFTGRVALEDFKRERPREYEALRAAGRLEEGAAEPLPLYLIKALRIFAWCALAAGFALVLGIIYAMLFAYK